MAKQNLKLMDRMCTEILRHFKSTGQGITYEDLTKATGGASMEAVNNQLSHIGQRDIDNNRPPLDAIVVNKSNGIPSPEHFLHKQEIGYIGNDSLLDYYSKTVSQLVINNNIDLNKDWWQRVERALRR